MYNKLLTLACRTLKNRACPLAEHTAQAELNPKVQLYYLSIHKVILFTFVIW